MKNGRSYRTIADNNGRIRPIKATLKKTHTVRTMRAYICVRVSCINAAQHPPEGIAKIKTKKMADSPGRKQQAELGSLT